MPTRSDNDEIRRLYHQLLPVLSAGAIGDFSGQLELAPAESREYSEIVMGVQVLLDVIREQGEALAAAQLKHQEAQQRTAQILDDVLKNSLDTDDRQRPSAETKRRTSGNSPRAAS